MRLRKRFLVALAISIALHLVVISGPGWYMPTLADLLDSDDAERIEAHLVASRAVAVLHPARQKPMQPKKPQPPVPPPDAAKVSRGVTGGNPRGNTAPEVDSPPPVAPPAVKEVIEPEEAILPGESLSSAIVGPVPPRVPLPKYVRIRYQVTMGDNGFLVGSLVQELRHDGTHYSMRNVAETAGLAWLFRPVKISNFSEGEIVGGALRPREFRIERSSGKNESARFDWQAGQALLSNQRQFALEAGTQDMLSMFAQLALMDINGDTVSMPVVTGKKVERYDFTVLGQERIMTPRGERMALHLRNRQPDSKEGTEVWLGLDDARLPIKIRHVDRRGDVFDQVADRIEFEETEGKR